MRPHAPALPWLSLRQAALRLARRARRRGRQGGRRLPVPTVAPGQRSIGSEQTPAAGSRRVIDPPGEEQVESIPPALRAMATANVPSSPAGASSTAPSNGDTSIMATKRLPAAHERPPDHAEQVTGDGDPRRPARPPPSPATGCAPAARKRTPPRPASRRPRARPWRAPRSWRPRRRCSCRAVPVGRRTPGLSAARTAKPSPGRPN